jgi:cytochrome c-type biogenesis protein CcmH/NrfG
LCYWSGVFTKAAHVYGQFYSHTATAFAILETKMSQKLKPTVVTTGTRFSKRAKVITLCVVVVLVAAGVAWWLVGGRTKVPEVTQPTQPSAAKLRQDLDKYTSTKDYKGAIRLLKSQPGNNSDTQKLLASTYANAGDYKNALTTYDNLAQSNNLSGEDTATAAEVAERAGDFKLAAQYYREAAKKVAEEKTPTYSDQVLMYNAKAKELEKKL